MRTPHMQPLYVSESYCFLQAILASTTRNPLELRKGDGLLRREPNRQGFSLEPSIHSQHVVIIVVLASSEFDALPFLWSASGKNEHSNCRHPLVMAGTASPEE